MCIMQTSLAPILMSSLVPHSLILSDIHCVGVSLDHYKAPVGHGRDLFSESKVYFCEGYQAYASSKFCELIFKPNPF